MTKKAKSTGPENDVRFTRTTPQSGRPAKNPIEMPTRVSCEAEFEQWLEVVLESERQKLRKQAALKRPGAKGLGRIRASGGQTTENRF